MDDLFKLEEKNKLLLKEIQCQKAKLNSKEEEIESSKRKLKWLTEFHKKLLKRVAEFLLMNDFDDEDYQSLIEDYLQIYDVTREEFKKKFRPKDKEALKNHSNFLLPMDSSSKQETNTDVPQNRLNEGCLLKLQSDNKKYAEQLQELNAKLAAMEIEFGGLKEMIKARQEKLWDLMDARDQLGLVSEDNEE